MKSFRMSDMREMPRVKNAAYEAPVLITDNGYPAFIFMTIKQYEELKKKAKAYDELSQSFNEG